MPQYAVNALDLFIMMFRKIILSLVIACWFGIHSFAQSPQAQKLSNAALELTKDRVVYDPAYFKIAYPNGDVPVGKGVCTDVVIRAYRKLGTDLQKEVHEDMKANFRLYPKTGA